MRKNRQPWTGPRPRTTGKCISQGCMVALLGVLAACGPQKPAFKEDQSQNRLDGLDANGTSTATSTSASSKTGQGGAPSSSSEEVLPGHPGHKADDGVEATASNGGHGTDGGAGNGAAAGAGSAGGAGTGAGSAGGSPTSGSGATGTGGASSTATASTPPANEGTVDLGLRTVDVVQKGGGKVDILWVIDTSASMTEEQQGVASNLNALITQLQASGNDFQTAITTTDVCSDTLPADLAQRACPVLNYGGSAATHLKGSFVGDPGRKVLKQGDSDLISRFNTYVNQGVNGSDFEHGLYGAKLAIDKVQSGANEPLIRSDAFLSIIVVSDEEDDGIGLGMVDAYNHHNFVADGLTTFRFTDDDMISYLKTVKGAGNFAISGVVTTRDNTGNICSTTTLHPREEGTQYISAAKKTGGIIQSICDTNWTTKLSQIGQDINAEITQIALPSVPDVATIKVMVDGVTNGNWTYNSGNNAVKFNAGSVPAVGAAIHVSYYDSQKI